LGGFPDNVWVGTTVDTQARVSLAEKSFRNISAKVKWLSIEPMLEPLKFGSLEMFDLMAIGGQSRTTKEPEFQPEWEWVENLLWQARQSGTSVYFKENLKSRPKEAPWRLGNNP
jgi:protein gp37